MNTTSTSTEVTDIASMLYQEKYTDVINLLKEDPGKEADRLSMLALAYFHSEQYELAVITYEKALVLDPSNPHLQDMLRHSSGNYVSEVATPVPDVYYFDRDNLLSKPIVPEGSLPSTPVPPPPPLNIIKRTGRILGEGLGVVFTALMQLLTIAWGKIAGYRDKIWTNWYRRSFMLGILTLAYMREKMNAHNLKSTYPDGSLVGFQSEGQTPPEGAKYYRTADGSWNNLSNPKEGAAGTRFTRNINLDAAQPETGKKLLTPNPREISRHLLTRNEMKEVPFLNLLAASWIQFMNHDWINHGENIMNELIEIPLAADDPARKKFWQTKMLVPRTQHDPTRMDGKEKAPVSFINEVTHWWDASQVYGSNQQTVDQLRSGVDGKLNVNADGTLPLNNKGIEQTGFVRNWWVGLSMLHTLFTREHNAICDHLKSFYPDWEDNKLFNVARLINAAITAKIHSVEWTPAILPNHGLDTALNANWYGILTNLFQKGTHRKTVSGINIRNAELGGVVGNPIDKNNVSFGLTQEFVEVYRLHSLLPESLFIRRAKGSDKMIEVPFIETRQAGSAKLTKNVPFSDLFYSFGNQHPGQMVLNNFPRFMQELSIPFNPVYDLGAADILRCRERGVPRFNEFRRQLGLNPITKFEDLTDDQQQVQQLKEVYGDGPEAVEMLDLMIGNLAEGHRPSGFGFGETMFQIFILNATRRLQADRFYTDCYTEEYYTKEGLAWIDNTDFKAVILRHYPELKDSGLGNIKNAFEPWDTGERLDPARHPLRQWDKTLKPDPWKGDTYK